MSGCLVIFNEVPHFLISDQKGVISEKKKKKSFETPSPKKQTFESTKLNSWNVTYEFWLFILTFSTELWWHVNQIF